MQWIAVIGELLKSTAQASENSGGCEFLAVFTGFPRLLEGPGFFS